MSISEFADRLNEIMPVLAKEFNRRQGNELYKGKITLPQLLILEFLSRKEESRMTDLARFMRVSTPAMTGLAERLVRESYVLRTYEPRDRRIIKVRITPKGSELVKRISRQRREMVVKIFGRISEKERRDYLSILEHVHEILTEEKA